MNGRLPVEETLFFTPGNSLELNYVSAPGGNWQVQLNFPEWRGKDHIKEGDALHFRIYIASEAAKEILPQIALGTEKTQSASLRIDSYLREIKDKEWLLVKIPLEDFSGSGNYSYSHSKEITSVIFHQASKIALSTGFLSTRLNFFL
jgi:exo beta-1,2-glucooligosaccharide sophorohydrolase (non-reducing end)